MTIVDLTYLDDIPITRDLPRLHNFSALIKNPSEYNIISLEGEYIYNFKLQYLLSSEIKSNVTAFLQNDDEIILSKELFQMGISKQSTYHLVFSATFKINITVCEKLTHLCAAIIDMPMASWKESILANNIMCIDIKDHITCLPGKTKLGLQYLVHRQVCCIANVIYY